MQPVATPMLFLNRLIKPNRIMLAVICVAVVSTLISCTAKQPAKICFYEGEVAGGIVECAEMTAVINATAEAFDIIADKTRIDMLFITSLDGTYDEKALAIISECDVDLVYLPRQEKENERYKAITEAVNAGNGTVIEVDGAKSLSFGDAGIDLYYDSTMTALALRINSNGKRALILCGDASEKCFEYLSYRDARYDIVGVDPEKINISSLCERIEPKSLLVFASEQNSVSVPDIKDTGVVYSYNTLTVEY